MASKVRPFTTTISPRVPRLIEHPYSPAADEEPLTELVMAHRLASDVRLYPTLWRVRLLLSSRVWSPEADARVWENSAGAMAGAAWLWRRRADSSYLVLERFVQPRLASPALVEAMVRWADTRALTLAAELQKPIALYTSALHPSLGTDVDWAAHGFAEVPVNPDERNVYYARALADDLAPPTLPRGYVLRPLRGTEELEAYNRLYDFSAVNPAHQRHLLTSDEYSIQVIVNPADAFVAFCESSFCRAEWERGSAGLGWIDYVQTSPDYLRRGLGRAALCAGLRQLKAWGAETAMLVTLTNNTPAVALYRAAGFEEAAVSEAASYQKTVTPSHEATKSLFA